MKIYIFSHRLPSKDSMGSDFNKWLHRKAGQETYCLNSFASLFWLETNFLSGTPVIERGEISNNIIKLARLTWVYVEVIWIVEELFEYLVTRTGTSLITYESIILFAWTPLFENRFGTICGTEFLKIICRKDDLEVLSALQKNEFPKVLTFAHFV